MTTKILLPATLLLFGGGCDERIVDPFEASNDWVDVAQLPKPLSSFGAAVFRDRIFIAGGWEDGFVSSKSTYRFDGDRNVWDAVGDLPTGMAELNLVVAADTLFAVGGLEATTAHPSRRLYAYDEAADRWNNRPFIPDERHGNTVFAFDGKIYLIGGPINEPSIHGPRVPGDSVLEYNVFDGQWSYRDPMPTPRFGVTGVWNNDRFLTIGGTELGSGEAVSPIVDAYDPVLDTWAPVTHNPWASSQPAVAILGGEVHIIGGSDFPVGSSSHRVYNTDSDSWDLREEIWAPTGAAAAVQYRNEVYLIGGRVTRNVINRVMVYRPGV